MPTTLAQLRTRAQRRADMENKSIVATLEWADLINSARRALFDVIVAADENYLTTSATLGVTTYAGVGKYAATASTYYKILKVERLISGTDYEDLARATIMEKNRVSVPSYIMTGEGPASSTALGGAIYLVPPESFVSTDVIRVWYIPFPATMVADADFLIPIESQMDEFIVVDAAMAALAKEESDTSQLMAEKQLLTQRITRMAAGRDSAEPGRIIDVYEAGGIYSPPTLPRA